MSAVDEVKKLIEERDLSSFAQKFEESGMDEQVESWISTGQNLPVVGDQITKALGNDTVRDVATKLGITEDQAADELAQAVPEVVNEMTPEGRLPSKTPA